MNLVITGALGHLGSRLIHDLRPGEFDEVLLLDNFATQRYASLFHLPAGVRFRFVEADIRTVDLGRLFRGMHAVVHLAALTDAASSVGRQAEVREVNFTATARVAEACHATGCRLVFPSTTSVYGVQTGLVDETCAELKPQSPYADSKLAAEQWLGAARRDRGLDVVIGRLGTIFGPSIGMRFHTAVNKFVWQALTGEPLTVWRTALTQQRPYLDVADAVRALRFMLAPQPLPELLYNVVTTNVTVQEILDVIRGQAGDFQVELTDSPIMNQLSYEVSAARLAAAGFEFHGDLTRAIRDTVGCLQGLRAGRVTS